MKSYTCFNPVATLSAPPLEVPLPVVDRLVRQFFQHFPNEGAVWNEVAKWRPFAIQIANRFKPADLEPEDAAGIGIETLVECLEDFDPDQSNLGTWAALKIRSRMKGLRNKGRLLVEPLVFRFNAEDDFVERDVPAPEPEIADLQPDDKGLLAFRLLDTLPHAQATAVRLKLGLSELEPQTYEQIGQRLGGISKQRAEQLFRQALTTLRQRLAEHTVTTATTATS